MNAAVLFLIIIIGSLPAMIVVGRDFHRWYCDRARRRP